jgi:hypothetical protein
MLLPQELRHLSSNESTIYLQNAIDYLDKQGIDVLEARNLVKEAEFIHKTAVAIILVGFTLAVFTQYKPLGAIVCSYGVIRMAYDYEEMSNLLLNAHKITVVKIEEFKALPNSRGDNIYRHLQFG